MTTYNTGNPIGSTDARDRLDNSENMDILENSTTLNAHHDRLGVLRKTRKGMELEHDRQIAAHELEFKGRLAGMAFTRVGTFTAGATLTDMRQTLLWEISQGGDGHEYGWTGSFPKLVQPGSSPSPISAGSWVDRTDLALRGELLSGPITTRNGILALRDIVSVRDFLVGDDGITNYLSQVSAAITYCNENNKTLSFSGLSKVVLSGSGRITVQCNVDLCGCTLDVTNWSGGFDIIRKKDKVTYGQDSSVVTDLVASGTMSGNYFAGWLNHTEVNDSMVVINTSQPFYSYSGNLVYRTEFNKISRNGIAESPLKYPLDPTLITSVDVYPLEGGYTYFGGGQIYLGSRDFNGNLFYRSTSRHKIKDILFISDDVTLSNSNPVVIFDEWFTDLTLENVDFQWSLASTATSRYAYEMQYQNGYNWLAEKVKGFGDGWGATGGNIVQRCEFKDCVINRVDFHHPFREYLKLTDCRIGDYGLLITGIGDVIITNSEILRDNSNTTYKSSGYIRLRSEANGFVDGDLIVNGLKMSTNNGSTPYFIRAFATTTLANTAGSPITFACFNNIIARGLSNDNGQSINLAPVVESSSQGVLYPSSIVYEDCLSGLFDFSTVMSTYNNQGSDSVDSGSNINIEPNLKVNLTRVKISSSKKITITERTANNFCIHVKLTEVSGNVNNSPVSIQGSFFGKIDIDKSDIESIDFTSGGALSKKLSVNVSNSRYKYLSRVSYIINGYVSGLSTVKLNNCTISMPDFLDVHSNVLSQAHLNSNTYTSQATDVTQDKLKLQNPSSGNIGTVSAICPYNRFQAVFSDSTKYDFVLPDVGYSVNIVKDLSTLSTITRTATALSLIGTAPSFIYIR